MERVSQQCDSQDDSDFEIEPFKDPNDKTEFHDRAHDVDHNQSKKAGGFLFFPAMVEWNFEAVKEPRGFIKFIQVIIAIFAFATTCSHSTHTAFRMKDCGNGSPGTEATLSFGYTYKLSNEEFDFNNCTTTYPVSPYGDYSAPSQFFVFVGVMAFLYSLAALVLYVCFDDKYRKFDNIPVADFIITAVFTVLWLISSSAWADGVAKVKMYTDPKEIWINHVPDCHVDPSPCEVTKSGNFASLNVSIIFGFLNMLVWGGNLWFLYKETKWFKVQTEHPQQRTEPTENPQQI